MDSNVTAIQQSFYHVFLAVLIILAVLFLLCLIRAVIGPRVADRIMAVNMMGTMVIAAISILAVMMQEGYLVDVAIIYAMISFLAVIIISKVYMGVYLEKKKSKEDKENGGS